MSEVVVDELARGVSGHCPKWRLLDFFTLLYFFTLLEIFIMFLFLSILYSPRSEERRVGKEC